MAATIVRAGRYGRGHAWKAGRYVFQLSGSGHAELWNTYSGRLLWEAGSRGGAKLAMERDGNLVVYSDNWTRLWASNTDGNPGAFLAVQDDGNVVIYSAEHTPIWATDTAGG